ncbi:MAG: glutaredoxin family protein [Rhodocyclaceae bacterium]|nr:glutaredoxin family protein [Rhodocyclaceae bacterium]
MKLTFYGRAGCHLCDDMLAALEEFAPSMGFALEMRDVDADPEWRARFGAKVPVLMAGEREVCHYFLDLGRLCEALRDGEAHDGQATVMSAPAAGKRTEGA